MRRKYGLTVDLREADALERTLSGCSSTATIFVDRADGAAPSPPQRAAPPSPGADALALWDDNDNERTTCKEARRHVIAPVRRGRPAYPFTRDGDDDGVACE